MTRLSLWTVVFSCMLIAAFPGCRSITPAVNYYALSSMSEDAVAEAYDEGKVDVTIGIWSVELPGTINRTQMIRRTGNHRIEMSSFHRWADYPDRLVQQVLTQNLSFLLSDARVLSAPWPVDLKPDITVFFHFLELIGTADKKMLLTAEWTISGNQDPPVVQSHRRTFSEPIPGSGFDDLAAAHSQVLERLCREVAATLEKVISS